MYMLMFPIPFSISSSIPIRAPFLAFVRLYVCIQFVTINEKSIIFKAKPIIFNAKIRSILNKIQMVTLPSARTRETCYLFMTQNHIVST